MLGQAGCAGVSAPLTFGSMFRGSIALLTCSR